jgi:hypothetical protein
MTPPIDQVPNTIHQASGRWQEVPKGPIIPLNPNTPYYNNYQGIKDVAPSLGNSFTRSSPPGSEAIIQPPGQTVTSIVVDMVFSVVSYYLRFFLLVDSKIN